MHGVADGPLEAVVSDHDGRPPEPTAAALQAYERAVRGLMDRGPILPAQFGSVLADADAGAGRFLACALYARNGAVREPIYVHAKIGIVDDRWLTIGSANLNEHSLFNDTEVNVVAHDPALARALRLRLWAEHLGCEQAELEGDPARIVDERWRPLAEEQLERRKREEPTTHRLLLLPHVSRRSKGMLGPLNGFLVDG